MSDAQDPRHATGDRRAPPVEKKGAPRCDRCGVEGYLAVAAGRSSFVHPSGACNPPDDPVNSPSHYARSKDDPYEVWKVLRAWGLEEDAFRWTAVKYLARAGKKGDLLEDLRKAQWYLNRRIESLQAPQGKDVTVAGKAVEIRPLEAFATSHLDGVLVRGKPVNAEVAVLRDALRRIRDLTETAWTAKDTRFVGLTSSECHAILDVVRVGFELAEKASEEESK